MLLTDRVPIAHQVNKGLIFFAVHSCANELCTELIFGLQSYTFEMAVLSLIKSNMMFWNRNVPFRARDLETQRGSVGRKFALPPVLTFARKKLFYVGYSTTTKL